MSALPGRRRLVLLAAVGLAVACQDAPPPSPAPLPRTTLRPPVAAPSPAAERSAEALRRTQPAVAGLDRARLRAAVAAVAELPGVRSLLVLRGGDVVVEEHWRGSRPGERVNLKSASKSLLSALVGIALDRGELAGLDRTVGELLPEDLPPSPGARAGITVEELLTMTSGLASTSGAAYGPWVASADWVRAALARPLLSPPGSVFRYSTGNSHLLSAILTRATGAATLDYARAHLLSPLGIEGVVWQRDPQGIYFGGNNLEMTARQMARFGLLYLQGGRWGERQVIPAAWVAASTVAHSVGWPERYGAYGYLWWIRPPSEGGGYMAVGYGGQLIYVAPRVGMVVVVTSTPAAKGAAWDRRLLAILARGVVGAVVEGR